jgi:iron complex outermembrane receptor protein
MSARIAFNVPLAPSSRISSLTAAINVTNLTDKKAPSTLSIGAASGTYNFFPVADRQVFGTISARF